MTLKLKRVLVELNIKQSALAAAIRVSGNRAMSPATLAQIANHDTWPQNTKRDAITSQIKTYLVAHGASSGQFRNLFKKEAGATTSAKTHAAPAGNPAQENKESARMLLRKHTITPDARRKFGIPRDPFTDEMTSDSDVFLSDDIRYVRATIRQTAKHGGMLAVVGESGAGKSTLRHDLIDWINTNREPVTVIEPYVLGMEDSDSKGKVLKSIDIASAIIATIDPTVKPRRGSEARARQLHELLRSSAQTGRHHVLIIEEAHGLSIPTLKHLKRFFELQEGFKKLLGVVLIGQTELERKLSEHNPEVREVVQRCEIVRLPPLDNQVEAYLRHKLARVDVQYDALFEQTAVDEIRNRLRYAETEGSGARRTVKTRSLCYPLAVNNLVAGAMNAAAKIGAPKITGEIIAAAVRS